MEVLRKHLDRLGTPANGFGEYEDGCKEGKSIGNRKSGVVLEPRCFWGYATMICAFRRGGDDLHVASFGLLFGNTEQQHGKIQNSKFKKKSLALHFKSVFTEPS
jgi:hypothetical protein